MTGIVAAMLAGVSYAAGGSGVAVLSLGAAVALVATGLIAAHRDSPTDVGGSLPVTAPALP
ncbi:hypothetical protein [Mycobacterium sp. C31M]